jgi:hypothetical protein
MRKGSSPARGWYVTSKTSFHNSDPEVPFGKSRPGRPTWLCSRETGNRFDQINFGGNRVYQDLRVEKTRAAVFRQEDWVPLPYSDSGFAPGTRFFRNLIWPSWLDSCSAT